MPRYNVLFLCTGNSARSIMARSDYEEEGLPNFTAYSAGSHPSGTVRPEAIQQLEKAGLSTDNVRSKSWDEFSGPSAPPLHFVFTVCDNAAKETCPFWPGQPMTAHWGFPIRLRCKALHKKSIVRFRRPFRYSTAASACSFAYHWQRSIHSHYRRKLTTSARNRKPPAKWRIR